MRSHRITGLLAALALLSGCSLVPLDSLLFPPDLEGVPSEHRDFVVEPLLEEVNSARLRRPPGAPEEEIGHWRVDQVIVIGNTSVYRAFREDEYDPAFRKYRGFARRLNRGNSLFYDPGTFKEEFSGWTRLKILSIPGLFGEYQTVIVPRRFSSGIEFSDPVTTALAQGTGALVAARTTEEGLLAIVAELCPEDSEYGKCADSYRRGIFDGTTGIELNEDLTPRTPIRRIDPLTYRIITDKGEPPK